MSDTANSPRKNWLAADSPAFGLDRSELLQALAKRNPPIFAGDSYLLSRTGRLTNYLGPCVADSAATAHAFVSYALQTPSSAGFSWDILTQNANAVTLARELNFAPKRHLLRMVRGKDLRGHEEHIYAIAGFELG